METDKKEEQEIVKDFDSVNTKNSTNIKFVVALIAVVILGLGTGFVFAKNKNGGTPSGTISTVTKSSDVKTGTTLGTNDTKTFKDIAEGVLKNGGIEGEGQYHLERPGGQSQNVYLTSSTLDLSLVLGRKIKVWGQTQTAQHAGWLMDVGRVEVE